MRSGAPARAFCAVVVVRRVANMPPAKTTAARREDAALEGHAVKKALATFYSTHRLGTPVLPLLPGHGAAGFDPKWVSPAPRRAEALGSDTLGGALLHAIAETINTDMGRSVGAAAALKALEDPSLGCSGPRAHVSCRLSSVATARRRSLARPCSARASSRATCAREARASDRPKARSCATPRRMHVAVCSSGHMRGAEAGVRRGVRRPGPLGSHHEPRWTSRLRLSIRDSDTRPTAESCNVSPLLSVFLFALERHDIHISIVCSFCDTDHGF